MMEHLSQLESSSSPHRQDVANVAFAEDGMIVLMLNQNGLILNCNSVAATLFGCMTSQLLWQHASKFLPSLAGAVLFMNGTINPRLRFLSRIGHLFEVMTPAGEALLCRVFFNEVIDQGQQHLCLVICPETSGKPTRCIYSPD